MKIIALNGPPRCGKDTVATIVTTLTHHRARAVKFATVVKESTHAVMLSLMGVLTEDTLKRIAQDENYFEDRKDKPSDVFGGITPRQGYIAVSEQLVKPLFGNEFFGDRLADKLSVQRARFNQDMAVISDSGFASELKPLVRRFGAENIVVVDIYRDGCDFNNDSRGRFKALDVADGIQFVSLLNNSDISELTEDVRFLLQELEWIV